MTIIQPAGSPGSSSRPRSAPDPTTNGLGLTSLLSEFIRSPWTVGAIAPSSAALAREATAPVPTTGDTVVVELGAGTGAFTGQIQRRLAGRGRHIAIEINERFATRLATRYPTVDVLERHRGLEILLVQVDRTAVRLSRRKSSGRCKAYGGRG